METSELLSRLRELTVSKNPPPEGWLTPLQWAEKWGIAERTARVYLANGVKSKIIERRLFKPDGARQMIPHFRAADGAERNPEKFVDVDA